ncbi:MAG: hypothetical protein GXO82_10080 [Chlorobi bacterium]|nr:hypothetical protein [Chlorobiota bacterium]
MMKRRFFDNTYASSLWFLVLLGLNFVLMGIITVLLPEVLVFMVAAFFVATGISIWVTAWRLRKNRGWSALRVFFDDDYFYF